METVCTSIAVAASISFPFVVAINVQHCPAIPRRRWREATRLRFTKSLICERCAFVLGENQRLLIRKGIAKRSSVTSRSSQSSSSTSSSGARILFRDGSTLRSLAQGFQGWGLQQVRPTTEKTCPAVSGSRALAPTRTQAALSLRSLHVPG